MKFRTHKCSVPTCKAGIGLEKLMCLRHWRMVPGDLATAVYDAWDAYQKEQTEETADALRKAQNAATERVTQLERALNGGAS